MRLFDRVRRGNWGNETTQMFARVGPPGECVVIDAQPVVDWWDAHLKETEGIEALKAIARCAPPFQVSFIEWKERWENEQECGLYVFRDDHDDGSFTVHGNSWWGGQNETGNFPVLCSLNVAEDGSPDWASFKYSEYPEIHDVDEEWFREKFGETKEQLFRAPSIRGFVIALMTFRFMHARNVTLIERQATRQERRLAERDDKEPPTRFYTLDIAPITKRLAEEGQLGTVGLAKALHICRGHFADYTKGRGLFGKYKVEVFIPEHFKGRASRGRVEKDYRVHVAQDS